MKLCLIVLPEPPRIRIAILVPINGTALNARLKLMADGARGALAARRPVGLQELKPAPVPIHLHQTVEQVVPALQLNLAVRSHAVLQL